jgi:hypothetical protein
MALPQAAGEGVTVARMENQIGQSLESWKLWGIRGNRGEIQWLDDPLRQMEF